MSNFIGERKTSRRALIGGAMAGVAIPALLRPDAGDAAITFKAKQSVVRRGRSIAVGRHGRRGRVLVVAHEGRRTIAIYGKSHHRPRIVDVGGQPLELAISPDGRRAAVTTAFWDQPGLAIVDLKTGKLSKRVAVGPAPFAVAYTPAGDRILVSGGEQEGTLHVLDAHTLKVKRIARPGIVPRGIAVEPDGENAWVAINGDGRVARVNLRKGHLNREIKTATLPDRIAVDPAGHKLLVSHSGLHSEKVTEIVLKGGHRHRHRVGGQPSAVGWTQRGRRVINVSSAGELVVLGPGRGKRAKKVGGSPRGLAISGRRAWIVDEVSGRVRSVKL